MGSLIKQIVEYGILGALGVMSLVIVYVAVERYFYYKSLNMSKFGSREELEFALTKNLTLLYTIGANAVYVGLLGTVLGIIATFAAIGEGGAIDAKAIMSHLSYTLIATAAGLVVAIPSMVFYNALVRTGDRLLLEWGQGRGA
jgi:biopolymer transport protein ExbB